MDAKLAKVNTGAALKMKGKKCSFDKSCGKSTFPPQNMFLGQKQMSPLPTRFTETTLFLPHDQNGRKTFKLV